MEQYADEVASDDGGQRPRPAGPGAVPRTARRSTCTGSAAGPTASAGAMQVAHAFLGLRLECAQCHRHPHDVWQQDDLLTFANFFMRVRKVGFEGDNEKQLPGRRRPVQEVQRRGQEARGRGEEAQGDRRQEARRGREEGQGRRRQADPRDRPARKGEEGRRAAPRRSRNSPAARRRWRRARGSGRRLAEQEKQAKLMPEIARRLLQAEVRLLPPGTFAKVTSPHRHAGVEDVPPPGRDAER